MKKIKIKELNNNFNTKNLKNKLFELPKKNTNSIIIDYVKQNKILI